MRLLRLCRRFDVRREDGIALVVALGVLLILTITTVTAVTMATSSQSTTDRSTGAQTSYENAEAGINNVESMLNYDIANNINPSTPTIFGCGTGTAGASDCTTHTSTLFCVQATTCTAGKAGSVTVYGWFSGTNSGTFNGKAVAASTWAIVSTGYAAGPGGTIVSRARTSTIKVNALNSGAVAAVWNHIFLTAPLVPGVCQVTYSGTNETVNAPMYVIGNLCLTGTNTSIAETTQPVDLEVGGVLVMSGTHTTVGASGTPITSGVVVGGCASAINGTASSCTGSTWSSKYYVGSTDTYSAQAAPTLTTSQIETDYTGFDPGPKHPCASGTTPAAPAGGTTGAMFDSTISSGEGTTMAPDTSGSNTAGTAFDLTPASSYACISSSGTGTGYLIWNNSSTTPLTVSGITVPAKTLAINGSIFFDSNVTASQTATYMGQGVVEFSGTFTTAQTICAVWKSGSCDFSTSDWQGASSNQSMLTLVSTAASNSQAINFSSTNGAFQGSLWTQPSSTAAVGGTNFTIEGPMSVGSLNLGGTNATLIPLPVIKNMPAGAPLPPNTGATINAPSYTS